MQPHVPQALREKAHKVEASTTDYPKEANSILWTLQLTLNGGGVAQHTASKWRKSYSEILGIGAWIRKFNNLSKFTNIQ